MTLPFPVNNFVVVAYKGNLTAQNVSLLTSGASVNNQNQVVKQGHQSKVVPTTFDWLNIYTTQAVSVNFQSQNTQGSSLDKLLMIYVDNSQNTVNTYIYFGDSQQYILAPAYSVGYYPVFTTQSLCTVYNGTSGKEPITKTSASIIIFCNFATPGFLASSTFNITYQNSGGAVVPVLGDQYTTGQLPLTTNPAQLTLLPIVAAPVQYVLTGILVSSYAVYTAFQTTPNLAVIELFDSVSLANIRVLSIIVPTDLTLLDYKVLIDETDLNIPCQGLVLFASTDDTISQTAGFIQASITYAKIAL